MPVILVLLLVGCAAEVCLDAAWYRDADGDGAGDRDHRVTACEAPAGHVRSGRDCDDTDPAVSPSAAERCDGIDNDCDAQVDEDSAEDAPTWYADRDGDGYGQADSTAVACAAPAGFVAEGTDCDDADAAVSPAATETWYDGTDADCDGWDDWDADQDGHVSADHGGGDCDDTDPDISPDATETWYDGVDQDCAGDDDHDADADGWQAESSGGEDCDDGDAAVNPEATEVCDGRDDDCDDLVDDADDSLDRSTWLTWYRDSDGDGDGYGDAGDTERACSPSSGFVGDGTDCDDTEATVNPGVVETWYDGTDSDSDGADDDDADGDGYRAESQGGSDCDDQDPAVRSGVAETWYDGVDGNCDDWSDGDADGDGFDLDSYGGSDCDDGDDEVNPDAVEECGDGVDQDCDGDIDESDIYDEFLLQCAPAWLAGEASGDDAGVADVAGDVDGDGWLDVVVGAPGESSAASDAGAGYLVTGPLGGVTDLGSARAKLTGLAASDAIGTAVAGLGDGDGDGFADLVLASLWEDTAGSSGGVAYLVRGPVSGTHSLSAADATITGAEAWDRLGYAVAGVGDQDGDGLPDLLVGAIGADGEANGVGAALLFSGTASGSLGPDDASARLLGPADGGDVGASVASAGDTDGDGVEDPLVGAWNHAEGGVVVGGAYLVLGPVAGDVALSTQSVVLWGEATAAYAGTAVASAGDMNGDGLDDVLVGASREDTGGSQAGAAYLLLGPISTSTGLGSAHAKLVGETYQDAAGAALDGAGDVDGDGQPDLLVGAPDFRSDSAWVGAAYVVLGPVTGTLDLSRADARLEGRIHGEYAGSAVAGTGDVDGDGRDDLLVGAPGAYGGGSGTGGVVFAVMGAAP